MVIKIQTQQTGIPVEIGELKFTFDTSDESIKNFVEAGEKFTAEISTISEDDHEAVREVIKKGYDLILGDGAFDKIYEQVPSLIRTLQIFTELSEAITSELSSIGNPVTQQDKAQQYIRHKNKRPHNKQKKK